MPRGPLSNAPPNSQRRKWTGGSSRNRSRSWPRTERSCSARRTDRLDQRTRQGRDDRSAVIRFATLLRPTRRATRHRLLGWIQDSIAGVADPIKAKGSPLAGGFRDCR